MHRSVAIIAITVLLALLPIGRAHGQPTDPPAATSSVWSPPTATQVDDAVAAARAQLEAADEAAPIRAELERLLAILGRQKTLLDELAAPGGPAEQPIAADTDAAVPIDQLDAHRADLAAARARVESTRSRLDGARRAVEEGAARLAEAQRLARAARETVGDADAPDPRIAEVRAQAAEADLNARRIERRIAESDAATAVERAQSLAALVESASRRATLGPEQLADQLASIERARLDLEAQLERAQGNLDFASDRLMAARRRLDEQGGSSPELSEETAARTLWRDAYRRETELLSKAIERAALRREIWEIRARLHQDAQYRRSGAAGGRLREIEAEIDRGRRVLGARADEARALLDRAAPQDGADGSAARWSDERQQAARRLVEVLDHDRRRLDTLAQQVAYALDDAAEADADRSLGDRARAAWRALGAAWRAEVFVVEDRSITVGKIAMGIALLLAGLWLARITTRLIGRLLLPHMGLNEGAAAAVQSIIFYLLLVTIALFALRMINIPLTVFTVLGGAMAIGLGFGSQNLMNNFISGLIILAERPIRVGDLIQIGELHGIVQHVGARSTRILTPNNIDIIVPNSSFLESNVTNWTLTEDRIRTSILVGVAYGSPTREVIKLMKKAADDHGKVIEKPAPVVLFVDFGDNALMFELIFWVHMRRMMERRIVESDLRLRINELFHDAGITIAFPQRDIHLDTLAPLEVRLTPPAEANEDLA